MRARAFIDTRFVLRPTAKSEGDHWFGGKGDYKGAECSKCRNPLLLLADLNCIDPILRKVSGGKFGLLTRLPLFVCTNCMCELSYLVDAEQRVNVVQTRHGNSEPGPWYEGFPEYFPRKPIRLDASVPTTLPSIIEKWKPDVDLRGAALSTKERRLLEDYFGHPIFIPRFMYHHQLGGESLFESWDESAFICPNKQCSPGLWNNLMRRGRPMRFLAGILNDPPGGLPFYEPLTEETEKNWNYFASFYFQICDKCLTITTFGAGS